MTAPESPARADDVWDDPTGAAQRRRIAFDVAVGAVFTLAIGAIQLSLSPASAE